MRKNLSVVRDRDKGNEYAQQLTIGLPDGTQLVITNVYMPPTDSLNRRGIDEEEGRAEVEAIV